MQAWIAILADCAVPFVCSETHELGEETIASSLYQVHLYPWLEANGHGRDLADQACSNQPQRDFLRTTA